ncbi:hypothetical protein N24_0485 [Corynebacterium suranareeae]|uniref:Uncharacterized protein n=1 Tax=Corynebacterium suranareeae TaxID=2506452 RepID=A0A160PLV3_9CORY|nr:hypothetical protein [Corynebacterium suranareeae]BAU94747.1 hypothetical protein N24_0485 [Corynebacterium suranareeae]
MARKYRVGQRQRAWPIWLSILVIVVLLVGAGALSVFALKSVKESDKNEGFSTTKDAFVEQANTEAPAEVVEEASIVESDAAGAEVVPLVAPQRQIAQYENTAVRAEVGTCTDPGMLEVSTNGGETWVSSESFTKTSATQVLRLIPVSTSDIFVVALNADCEPRIYGTTNQGQNWQEPVSAVGTWYLNPLTPTQLTAPGGTKTIGCEALSISARTDSNVDVLCTDGQIISTTDGGTTWSDPIHIDGALNVGHSNGDQVLMAQQPGVCRGIQFSAGTQDSDNSTCLETELLGEDAGQIAATRFGESILAWVGQTQFISEDGGQSWQ